MKRLGPKGETPEEAKNNAAIFLLNEEEVAGVRAARVGRETEKVAKEEVARSVKDTESVEARRDRLVREMPTLFDEPEFNAIEGRLRALIRAGIDEVSFEDKERDARELLIRIEQTRELAGRLLSLTEGERDQWLAEQGITRSKIGTTSKYGLREAVALALQGNSDAVVINVKDLREKFGK